MGGDVFISYSSVDKTVAEAVCSFIETQGMTAWMAPRDIVAGKPWAEAIVDAINACKAMVIIFSTHSDQSPQVMREVERAVSKRIAVIPFRIENIQPSKGMEYFLSSSHWLDAFAKPHDQHFEKLAAAVKSALQGDRSSALTSLLTGRRTGRAGRFVRVALAAGVAILLAAAGTGVWWIIRPAALMDPTHIAVLPFRNLANDAKIDHLSLQMPLALDSQLSRAASLFVVPFGSAMNYKDMSPPEIAKVLNVGTIVEGSFSFADQELNVNVNIVDTNRNRYMWSEPFQALLTDIRNLIDRMVPKIAGALQLRSELEPGKLMLGTQNADAYEAYLRGLTLGLEITLANNNAAIQSLKRAVSLDANFAQAHAALAEAYVTHFWWNFSNDAVWLDQAETSARKALQLGPALPEAHYAMGYAVEGKGQRAAAAREYLAAVKAGPHYVPALISAARYSFYMGDFKRALALLDTIASIDPTNNVHIRRAMCFYFSGQLQESRSENRLAERSARGVDQLTLVAFTYVWLKDLDAAERILKQLEREQPTAFSLAEIRAWLFIGRNDFAHAREQMQIIGQRDTFGIADEIATFYALLGDKEQAIDWLSKAVSRGAPNYAWYSSDFFKVLRGDPRYAAVLKTLSDEYAAVLREAQTP